MKPGSGSGNWGHDTRSGSGRKTLPGGEPAASGRHIPVHLKNGLLVAGRECDIEGCRSRGYLEIDHIQAVIDGGLTAYENLHWLCYRHHKQKTNGSTISEPDPETGKRTLTPPPAGIDRAPPAPPAQAA